MLLICLLPIRYQFKIVCLQCFDTVGWAACKKLSGGILAWLSVWVRCRSAYGPADATATHYLLLQ